MIRFRAWGLSAAVAGGLFVPAVVPGAGAPAVAAGPPEGAPAEGRAGFSKMFGPAQPKGRPAGRHGPAPPTSMPPAAAAAPPPPEVVADALRAEQDAYLRRLSVCSELRRIGADTNDEALIRQADELERQAAAVYNQRVAVLGVPKVKAPISE